MTVAEAMDRIDSDEFSQWIAYYEDDPWGESRIEMAIAKGNYVRHPKTEFATWVYQPPLPVAEPKKGLAHKVMSIFGAAIAVANARNKK
jgi:hypothetical protein